MVLRGIWLGEIVCILGALTPSVAETLLTHESDVCYQRMSEKQVLESVTSIMRNLQWTTLSILHDNSTDVVAHSLFAVLETPSVIENVEKFIITKATHKRLSSGITILICGGGILTTVFHEIESYARRYPGQSAIPFESKWLIVSEESSLSSVTSLVQDIDNIAFLSLQKLVPCGLRLHTLMYKAGGRLFSCIGEQNNSGPLKIFTKNIFPNTNFGFNGRRFNITTALWIPFVYVKDENGTESYYGFTMDLLHELAQTLNFSYDISRPTDHEFGSIKNGKWTGMIGQLYRREVDMMVSATSVEEARESVMDFTYPYFDDYFVIVMKKPGIRAARWLTLANIFQWPVLVLIAISLAFVISLMFVLEKKSLSYKKPHCSFSFVDMAWHVYRGLLMQGGTYKAVSTPGRILLLVWGFFAIMTGAIYSGNLVAFFTVTKVYAPISTLEELVNQEQYTWGTIGGGVLTVIFQKSNLTTFKKLWDGILKFEKTDPDLPTPLHQKHIEKVEAGGYAYIIDKTAIDFLLSTNCDITIGREQFMPQYYALGVQTDSPLKGRISQGLTRILQSGLVEHWRKIWWDPNNYCNLGNSQSASALELVYLEAAFSFLLIGLMLATFTIIIEAIVKRKQDNKCVNF